MLHEYNRTQTVPLPIIEGALETLQQEEAREKSPTKKDQVLSLYHQGVTDVAVIGRQTKTHPSYVAQVLRQAGLLTGYFDLYTSTNAEQNVYSRFFRHVLSFKNVEAAKKSVDRIDSLYQYFEEIGDRAGQHQAMVLALTGKNRARWSGKHEEAKIFSDWLAAH
ncbi:MAG: hypothetical protein U0Y68_03860 [Blastocatellia bacterium]